jgi:hypothetical protein
VKESYDSRTEFHFDRWKVEGIPRAIYSSGKRVVCTSAQDLAAVIARASSANLDIKIDIYLHENLSIPRPVSLLSLLQDLFEQPISSRVARLDICLSQKPNQVITDFVSEKNIGPYPALEDLIIRRGTSAFHVERLLYSIRNTAQKLRNLHVDSDVISPSWSRDSIGDLWTRISSMTLNDAIWIDRVLPQCVNLVHFKHSLGTWPEGDVESDILMNVQSLDIRCQARNLYRLRLPALQVLVVVEDRYCLLYPSTIPETFELPNLTSLRAECYNPIWVTRISAPRLKELELKTLERSTTPYTCWHPGGRFIEGKLSLYECILKPSFWSQFGRLCKLSLNCNCEEAAFLPIMNLITDAHTIKLSPKAPKET